MPQHGLCAGSVTARRCRQAPSSHDADILQTASASEPAVRTVLLPAVHRPSALLPGRVEHNVETELARSSALAVPPIWRAAPSQADSYTAPAASPQSRLSLDKSGAESNYEVAFAPARTLRTSSALAVRPVHREHTASRIRARGASRARELPSPAAATLDSSRLGRAAEHAGAVALHSRSSATASSVAGALAAPSAPAADDGADANFGGSDQRNKACSRALALPVALLVALTVASPVAVVPSRLGQSQLAIGQQEAPNIQTTHAHTALARVDVPDAQQWLHVPQLSASTTSGEVALVLRSAQEQNEPIAEIAPSQHSASLPDSSVAVLLRCTHARGSSRQRAAWLPRAAVATAADLVAWQLYDGTARC